MSLKLLLKVSGGINKSSYTGQKNDIDKGTRKKHLQDLAAASSSRKVATGKLLDMSMSDNNFSIQTSKEHLR